MHDTDNIYQIPEENSEKEPWHKGPIRFILGLFLLLLIVSMAIPFYGIKTNPSPGEIPTIGDIFPHGIDGPIGNKTLVVQRNDYYSLIQPDDSVVKFAADRIAVASCASSSKVCYAKAIFYFVRDNFQYVNDPLSIEYVKTARQSLMNQGGDCDDASVLMASLLRAVGIQIRFVFEPGHVYIHALLPEALKRYKSDGNWVSLDGTCKYCEFGEISIRSINKEKDIYFEDEE